MRTTTFLATVGAAALLVAPLAGCPDSEPAAPEGETEAAATEAAPEQKQLELVYVEWSSEVASTHLVEAVLEDQLGYEVETTPVSAAAMWQAIATGDADAMVAAWLETTHGHYLERVKDDVVDLGPNLEGTKIGLVVPSYVEVQSIADLADNAEEFNGKIIGIEPGAGIMSKTEEAMEAYGLQDWELVTGSGATMTAALADAIKNEEPIVVTGWTPHWKFARWEGLRYLEDPKNVYGGEESIHTIVRKGFEEDHPSAYAFLDAFEWSPDQMAKLMVMNQEGGSPEQNAREWMKQNPEQVNAWLEGIEGAKTLPAQAAGEDAAEQAPEDAGEQAAPAEE